MHARVRPGRAEVHALPYHQHGAGRDRGGTGAKTEAALAHFVVGEGREAVERAKQAGEAIVERGRLLKEYGESHHNALKALVRRQEEAFADIFAALSTYQNGDDDAA